MTQDIDWVAADCRAGMLSLFAIAADGRIRERRQQRAPAQDLVAVVRRSAAALAGDAPILLAGAPAEARQVPCTPLPATLAASGSPPLRIVPPLAQAAPPARSDGAEARVAGLLARRPGFDGVACVVGPRMTHWLHLSAGEVVSLQGFATGALLAGLAAPAGADAEAAGFDAALDAVLSRPERLAAALGAAQLDPSGREAAILGALVGAELAAARPYWLGQEVTVIGEDPLAAAMTRALAQQGVAVQQQDDAPLLLAGLAAARG